MRIAVELTPWEKIALRAGIQKNWFAEADSVVRTQSGTSNPVVSENSTAIAEANGTAGISHVKEKISEMIIHATLIRSTLEAAIMNCNIGPDGAAFPNELQARVDAVKAAHAGLPKPEFAGGNIAIRRKSPPP